MTPGVEPVEPPATGWSFPDPLDAEDDLVAVGADLEPGTILAAYRSGIFPMRIGPGRHLGWWSPDPRGVIPLDGLRVTRSLARSSRRYRLRMDSAFTEVVRACADPTREHGWIDESFVAAYSRLYELGWAHSVEVYDADDALVGGLYGLAINGLFAGESMFHRARDTSKVALVALVDHLVESGLTLLDVQWCTPHLASLGAVELPRSQYLHQLTSALARPARF